MKPKQPGKKSGDTALTNEKVAVILIAVVVGALILAAAVIGIVALANAPEEESSTKENSSQSDIFTDDYETEGDFRYTVENGAASVYQYMGTDKAVRVPETLGGYTVTELSAYSFLGNEDITSVFLPKSIAVIGADAFGDAPLSTVTYGGSIEEWNVIIIDTPNTALLGATVICEGD